MTDDTDDTTDWEPTDDGEQSADDGEQSTDDREGSADDGERSATGGRHSGGDSPADEDRSTGDGPLAGYAADDGPADADGGSAAVGRGTGADRSLSEYVQWSLLAILLLLTLIATLQFYFAASTAVDRFVTRQYRPLFQAGFNLVILLGAGVGLSVLVRRLS